MTSSARAGLFLLVLTLPALAFAEEASKPKAFQIGEKVDFAGPQPDGKEFRLSDIRITKEKAWEAVKEVAGKHGADAKATQATAIADLPGVKDEEGNLDEAEKQLLVWQAGRTFGLVPTEERIESMKTLGDVAAWIAGAEKSPVVVLVWSPSCPACKNVWDDCLVELLGETGARLVAVDSDFRDTAEVATEYVAAHGWAWRVVMDQDQKVTDRLGGERTPHVFLLDSDMVLRYRGAIDLQPDPEKGETEGRKVLREAITAVQKGEKVPVETTEPAG